MITISATSLRSKLFDYLDKAAQGETIIIQRNNRQEPTAKAEGLRLVHKPEPVTRPPDRVNVTNEIGTFGCIPSLNHYG